MFEMASTVASARTPTTCAGWPRCTGRWRRPCSGPRDIERAAEFDLEFHREIARATHNELFLILMDAIGEALLEIRRANLDVNAEQTIGSTARSSTGSWPATRTARWPPCRRTSTTPRRPGARCTSTSLLPRAAR